MFYFVNIMVKLLGGRWRVFNNVPKDVEHYDEMFYILMKILYFNEYDRALTGDAQALNEESLKSIENTRNNLAKELNINVSWYNPIFEIIQYFIYDVLCENENSTNNIKCCFPSLISFLLDLYVNSKHTIIADGSCNDIEFVRYNTEVQTYNNSILKVKLKNTESKKYVIDMDNNEFTDSEPSDSNCEAKTFILKLLNNNDEINDIDFEDDDENVDENIYISELLLFDHNYNDIRNKYYIPSFRNNKTSTYTKEGGAYKKINLYTSYSLTPEIRMMNDIFTGESKNFTQNLENYLKFLLDMSAELHKKNLIFGDWKLEQFGMYDEKIVCVDTGVLSMEEDRTIEDIPRTYFVMYNKINELNYLQTNDYGTAHMRNYIYDEVILLIDICNVCLALKANGFNNGEYVNFLEAFNEGDDACVKMVNGIYNKKGNKQITDIFLTQHLFSVIIDYCLKNENKDKPFARELIMRVLHFLCVLYVLSPSSDHDNPLFDYKLIGKKSVIIQRALTDKKDEIISNYGANIDSSDDKNNNENTKLPNDEILLKIITDGNIESCVNNTWNLPNNIENEENANDNYIHIRITYKNQNNKSLCYNDIIDCSNIIDCVSEEWRCQIVHPINNQSK